ACSAKHDGETSTQASPPVPFEAVSPAAYVAKVKNVLVALPPTDDEIRAVTADPSALKGLIVGWQQLPQYQAKMQRFFELALQQTQISIADFADQSYPKQLVINGTTAPQLVQGAEQSFARTMLELISEGRPLTDAATTPQLMMTTALKELYAFLDVYEVDDDGKVSDGFKTALPKVSVIAEAAQGPIPIADTLNPQSPNFMHWYDPDVATANSDVTGCAADPLTFPSSAMAVHRLLYGSLDGYKGSTGVACPPFAGSASAAQLTAADFSDWTMVSLRAPGAGETVTPFYDLPALRSATELVLSIPRVGFFSTPAFFANWQTNISNEMRVTLNQSLIVALGAQVDGTDATKTPGSPPPGLDSAHAGSGACFGCHQSLDPLRSIFAASYSWNYHNQLDPAWSAQKGLFSFQGVTKPVASMADFGGALGAHPLFAQAWVQKLCYYVNSSPCLDSDPELSRIVSLFQSSGYAWNTLVSELLSSPLVTNASRTATSDAHGEVVAVARRDHLCAALDARLGLTDVCGLRAVTAKAAKALIPSIAAGLPSDGYGRGSVAPVLPNQPTLFYRAGLENICETVAAQTIDVASATQQPNVKQWSSGDPDTAIGDFVSLVMALAPSDPRSGPASDLLHAHFTQAVAAGQTPTNALKSTFVVACLAPSSVSVGL
ncbi:MAG TPA: hypothetical protein VNW92_05385, partial [Polyangiaceae bacterium]|nr:hypothetical protein [Polyangiaceae bacterium]